MDKEENVHILVNLTLQEAAVIKVLRDIQYGKVTIFMDHGKPVRRLTEESSLLQKEDGMSLSNDLNIYVPENNGISSEQ